MTASDPPFIRTTLSTCIKRRTEITEAAIAAVVRGPPLLRAGHTVPVVDLLLLFGVFDRGLEVEGAGVGE